MTLAEKMRRAEELMKRLSENLREQQIFQKESEVNWRARIGLAQLVHRLAERQAAGKIAVRDYAMARESNETRFRALMGVYDLIEARLRRLEEGRGDIELSLSRVVGDIQHQADMLVQGVEEAGRAVVGAVGGRAIGEIAKSGVLSGRYPRLLRR